MTEFIEISIIIGLASVLGIVASKLKQPPILGFIFAGVILGPILSLNLHTDSLELFSKIGISFLLFVVGLELNLKELKNMGKIALTTGIGQIVFASITGFLIAELLHFDFVASIYIGLAMTFSSTIIIVKLLSQKKELDSLHGKISIGFLLVQDIVAIIVLICISTFGNIDGKLFSVELFIMALKAMYVIAGVLIFVKIILPFVLKLVHKDHETLFIFVISYALLVAALVGSPWIGFSLEIGALIAGISLAQFYEHLQIESWMKPLRDFFLVIFFVLLGLSISITSIGEVIVPAIIFSLFVLIVNPLLMMIIMSIFGYHKRVSFFTSLSVGQISEFSLLLISLGVSKGILSNNVLALVTIVGAITMTVSSQMILYNDFIYEKLKGPLSFFRFRKKLIYDNVGKSQHVDHIILLGIDGIGKNILESLLKKNEKMLVVDYNPENVEEMIRRNIPVYYGDIRDVDLFETMNID